MVSRRHPHQLPTSDIQDHLSFLFKAPHLRVTHFPCLVKDKTRKATFSIQKHTNRQHRHHVLPHCLPGACLWQLGVDLRESSHFSPIHVGLPTVLKDKTNIYTPLSSTVARSLATFRPPMTLAPNANTFGAPPAPKSLCRKTASMIL